MSYVISEKHIKKAKKEYDCNACLFLDQYIQGNGTNDTKMSISEIKAYLIAKKNNYKIQIGEPYLSQMLDHEGDICFIKSIPAIHKICCDLGLYDK